ncbi:MAG: TonB family protein [Flavobacteriales bacterium]
MSKSKSIQFNQKQREDFLKTFDARPTTNMEVIYIAIIVSLVAHIFILFISQMLTEDHTLHLKPIPEMLEMDLIEPEMLQQLPEPDAADVNHTGELRNVTANANSEFTKDLVDYRGMSQEQIDEMVMKDLKAMEEQEFKSLQDGKPVMQTGQKGTDEKKNERSKDNDWYKDNEQKKSYSGNVTASYDMSGRDALYNPVPTYRCKVQGTVVIDVVINQAGEVIDAKVNESLSSMNECLQTESYNYAKKWKFNYKADAAKKQPGPITFKFSAQ